MNVPNWTGAVAPLRADIPCSLEVAMQGPLVRTVDEAKAYQIRDTDGST